MSAVVKQVRRLTLDEYFQFESESIERNEFRDGVVISMAGARFAHSQIANNLRGEIRARMKGQPCAVLDSDLRVRVPHKARYYYPDATVLCEKPIFDVNAPDQTTIVNPQVIVEVLSASTERFDRGQKFADYRDIESLREYVLVVQDTARTEVYQRLEDGGWRFSVAEGLQDALVLKTLGITVPLAEIYAGVEFPEIDPSVPYFPKIEDDGSPPHPFG